MTDEERAEQTRADLAMLDRIRMGADFTQPARGAESTVAQLWGRLLLDDPTQRAQRLQRLLGVAGGGFRCRAENHVPRLDDLEREVRAYYTQEVTAKDWTP